ncbi:dienelactone hydrolase [Gaeumannomyces tritici R3-111a-1]|uniref:Dienelactone hydrolase n=1 Tax=Gaeumannomyces tritici (strain R3-111a-1) TaxID=644352 RepID=J3P5Y5_GAET3|nr:dienelactone hydrolase [Gaeumannomyces tritici R3-111a-1]EJT75087.1 dienelactone hydrolase [Gaeumannomyces tritici R3-111a-1]
MASNPPARCCTVGAKHEGSPSGKIVKVDSWDAYLAVPDSPRKDVAILMLPDVIGIWQNSQLLADQYAANGYTTMILDIYNGDPLSLNRPEDFDFAAWKDKGSDGKNPHTPAAVDPIVEAAVKQLKTEHGVKRLGAVGVCFGAKYVCRHFKSGIDVGFLCHPSFVDEEELEAVGPVGIAAAETDSIFPADKRHRSEEILKKTGQPYQISLYSGVVHGFTVRGNMSNKVERYAKEAAFHQAVQWFDAWL